MRIAILHNALLDSDQPDAMDVMIQVKIVKETLISMRHLVSVIPCGLNLEKVRVALEKSKPELVFNLVESLENQGRLIAVVPSLLESMGIPFTGSGSEAIRLTSNKVQAKEKMLAMGLPTPAWIGPFPADPSSCFQADIHGSDNPETWIVKSLWEHASLGLDSVSLLEIRRQDELVEAMHQRAPLLGGICFAEKYIAGREFNISILAGPDGPQVLAPAEILFEDYPDDKPKMVCYDAKWTESSFEFTHTPRRFDFAPTDKTLIDALKQTTIDCWRHFQLSGYARVDFRVDPEGNIWILEINTNPCLSPDAGFAAALETSGITFEQCMRRILDDALKHPDHRLPFSTKANSKVETSSIKSPYKYRYEPCQADADTVRDLVIATDFFHDYEVDVAVELITERLQKGVEVSGYHFVFCEIAGQLSGYACFGPIPCTASSYDVYWIAVHPTFQGKGLGKMIMGGTRIYLDTSQSTKYHTTREFYRRCHYDQVSVLTGFYAPGDGKVIYSKHLV